MKVILLDNVSSLGKKFDIVSVKDGYALNFLFPKKLAKPATEAVMNEIEVRRKKEMIKQDELRAFEREVASKIESLQHIVLRRKTSSKDHLFAAVTEKDIVEELTVLAHVELSPHNVDMKEHIKTLGEHKILIILGETKVPLTVQVEKSEEKK